MVSVKTKQSGSYNLLDEYSASGNALPLLEPLTIAQEPPPLIKDLEAPKKGPKGGLAGH